MIGRRAAFVRWARRNAIHFPVGDALASAVPSQLDPVASLLRDKRIVYLGEANHFIREKVDYRLLFLRALHGHGFDTVLEEIAWSDGVWIDRFLRTGDASALEHIGTFGHHAPARDDRDDAPAGILAAHLERQPTRGLAFEGRRFLRALREIGAFRFYGFDVDYDAGAGYEIALPLLADARSDAAQALCARLERVPGETLEEEATRLDDAVAELDRNAGPLVDELGADVLRTLRHALRSCAQGQRYVAASRDVPSYEALAPAMALREAIMEEHVQRVLQERPDDRLVLLSHDLHLAREDAGIRGPDGVVGPGGGTRPSVGCALAGQYGDDVGVVWMLEGKGHDASPLPGWSGSFESPRGTLNALLSKVGDAFALPTRSSDPGARLLAEEIDWMSMNGARFRCVVRDQADVLFFVREVSPLRTA